MTPVYVPAPLVHWTGCGYYYTNEQGKQLCKMYRTLGRLYRYGRISSF